MDCPQKKYGEYDNVDGLFLKNQPKDKTWYKVSDGAKATVYFSNKRGLYVLDTTSLINPARLIWWKYYVNWVDKSDKSRETGIKPHFK